MVNTCYVYRRIPEKVIIFKAYSFIEATSEEMHNWACKGLPLSQAAWMYTEQLPTMQKALMLNGFFYTEEERFPWGKWMLFVRFNVSTYGSSVFPMWVFESGISCHYCKNDIYALAQSSDRINRDCVPLCKHHLNIWLIESEMKGFRNSPMINSE